MTELAIAGAFAVVIVARGTGGESSSRPPLQPAKSRRAVPNTVHEARLIIIHPLPSSDDLLRRLSSAARNNAELGHTLFGPIQS